ncbi:hypothetical protein SGHV020 [Glossina pallidipes salivary gland hypertrophy virus]|uniref:Uncharacterized protein n=1 Tax=Glossina hytrovirus (isolate Glossina pallidipes/Ethiopia/Seibersdorf/-) TaxID=379529 RepID=B0YLH4_GHVS|nr:hypothetical protein SGHV020 [Glossina pallidipes salivary gland hypertrophy virus]ABQ08793.1 hypothetical protein SGHV020 [Glossina pallidipes salivary gland hypertrophy virus]
MHGGEMIQITIDSGVLRKKYEDCAEEYLQQKRNHLTFKDNFVHFGYDNGNMVIYSVYTNFKNNEHFVLPSLQLLRTTHKSLPIVACVYFGAKPRNFNFFSYHRCLYNDKIIDRYNLSQEDFSGKGYVYLFGNNIHNYNRNIIKDYIINCIDRFNKREGLFIIEIEPFALKKIVELL